MTGGLKNAILSSISLKKYVAPVINESENKHIYDDIERKFKQFPSTDGKQKTPLTKVKLYKKCAMCTDSNFCVYTKMEPQIDNTTQRAATYTA